MIEPESDRGNPPLTVETLRRYGRQPFVWRHTLVDTRPEEQLDSPFLRVLRVVVWTAVILIGAGLAFVYGAVTR